MESTKNKEVVVEEKKHAVQAATAAEQTKDVIVLDAEEFGIELIKKDDAPDISYYKEKMNNKENIEVVFKRMTGKEADLTTEIGDVKIILPGREKDVCVWKRNVIKMTGGRRAVAERELAKTYEVSILSVNEAEKTVVVSSTKAKEANRIKLIQKIDEAIANGQKLEIPAVVEGVPPECNGIVIVNIGNLGIIGAVSLKEWSTSWTESFDYATYPGEVIKVVVMDEISIKPFFGVTSRIGTLYGCSRRLTIKEDPWKGIEEKFEIGTFIRVRCIEKSGKYFFGDIDGLKDVHLKCFYPERDKNVYVHEGSEYIGKIVRISEEKHILAVDIVSEVKEDE